MRLGINNPPEPKIERIPSLVSRVSTGDIKIPKFQRGFVWREEQILTLLESIYNGYPIGSLLFWLSEVPMKSERDLGGFLLPPTPDRYPRNYVLDGQQRLTAIYGVLKWPIPTQYNKLNVVFDLETEKFKHYTGDLKPAFLPMSILLDTSRLMDFREKIRALPQASTLLSKLDILYQTFQEYLIPVVTIKEKTVEEVCPIFERINSTGTHLDAFDLMVAATWSDNFDLNDKVNEIRDTGKLKDFENIANNIYLKMMAAIQGLGSSRSSIVKLRELTSLELTKLAERVKISAQKAIDFLSTDLHVPSDAFLPYENQLVAYSYFFSRAKNPTSSQLDILRTWFWQCGFSEHFRGATESILDKDLMSLDLLIEKGINQLSLSVSISERDLLEKQFWKTSAFTKTYCVLLATRNPKNITNGAAIDTERALSIFNNKEFHHIFPKEFLKKLGVDSPKRNNICNLCMLSSAENKFVLDSPPSDYMVKGIAALGAKADDVLLSNLIPLPSEYSWGIDDYDSFLQKRAATILPLIKEYCSFPT